MPPVLRLEQLVAAAVGGEEAAWHGLVERYAGLVWSVPRGSGLGTGSAADACQTTWLHAAERLGEVSGAELPTLLAGTARRETVRALRWMVDTDDEPGSLPPLARAVAELPARARCALRVASAGAGPAELAAGLGLPEQDAAALVRDARERLRSERPELDGMSDAALLDRLAAVLDDPPPPDVLASARAAYSWRSLEAELLPGPRGAPDDSQLVLRGASGSRLETFRGGGVLVELEVGADGEDRHLVGRVEPGDAVVVLLRPDGAVRPLVLDALGRFVADGLAAGPVALRLRLGDRTVRTGWLVL